MSPRVFQQHTNSFEANVWTQVLLASQNKVSQTPLSTNLGAHLQSLRNLGLSLPCFFQCADCLHFQLEKSSDYLHDCIISISEAFGVLVILLEIRHALDNTVQLVWLIDKQGDRHVGHLSLRFGSLLLCFGF